MQMVVTWNEQNSMCLSVMDVETVLSSSLYYFDNKNENYSITNGRVEKKTNGFRIIYVYFFCVTLMKIPRTSKI